MKKIVIMVMGVQRSGTSALFESLAYDEGLTRFNESIDSSIYYKYRLRPLPEIGPLLDASPGPVLLKPISETFHRSLEQLATEYDDYDVRMVWIFRDPVNVFYSMHRQGWVPSFDITHPCYSSEWVRRNQLALQFQRSHPDKIVFIRYKDCATDPLVFRQIATWLGVEGRSVFRQDSSEGRRQLPRDAQRKIDLAVGPTLDQLDAARTFRSRRRCRAKRATLDALTKFQSHLRKLANGKQPAADTEWNTAVCSATPITPSKVTGLQFWFDAERKFSTGFSETGPHHLEAKRQFPEPFHIPLLNGKHALFFPTAKWETRFHETSGIVRFYSTKAWSFLLEGRPFSVFTLFKPEIPLAATTNQRRAVVWRIGSLDHPANLSLQWDSQMKASQAVVSGHQGLPQSVATTAQDSHPADAWRIVFLGTGNDEQLIISINGGAISRVTLPIPPGNARVATSGCTLQLGGDESKPDALFFGAITELIVFDRELTAPERLGITRYLREKYHL